MWALDAWTPRVGSYAAIYAFSRYFDDMMLYWAFHTGAAGRCRHSAVFAFCTHKILPYMNIIVIYQRDEESSIDGG